jgi:TonB family protein
MKHLKELVGIASAAAFALSLTAVTSATTLSLQPTLNASPTVTGIDTKATCTAPHTSAAVLGTPWDETPTIVQGQGLSGASVVQIDLQPSGSLAHVALAHSSGNRWMDDAAIRTARQTRYTPETQNCSAVAGSYLLEVDF